MILGRFTALQPFMLNQQELNQVAGDAARYGREVEVLEERYCELLAIDASELDDLGELANSDVNEELVKVEQALVAAREEFKTAFLPLWEEVHRVAIAQTRRFRIGLHESDDTAQDAVLHVLRKLHKFHDGNFGGWLDTVLRNFILSRLRSTSATTSLGDENLLPGESISALKERSVEPKAISTSLDAYLASGTPKPEYKYLFIFASQLWSYLNATYQLQWAKEFRKPSIWEERRSCLFRCNQIALDWAEQQSFNEFGSVCLEDDLSLQDQNDFFEECLKRIRQKIAQNLCRHFARLMEFPPLLDYLLRAVPASTEIAYSEQAPCLIEMALVLQFDAWIGLPAQIWDQWCEEYCLKGSSSQSAARLLAIPAIDTDGFNIRKFKAITHWLAQSVDDDQYRKRSIDSNADHWLTEGASLTAAYRNISPAVRRLIAHAAATKGLLDLPIPFKTTENDEIYRQQKSAR